MKYTREQLSAILAKDSKKLINASAGTGKTYTLSTAVGRVITLDKEKKTKIAVFTFTKAAALELSQRLEVLPHFIGTIHSFALGEINKLVDEKLIVSEIMSDDKVKRLLLQSYIELFGIGKNYKEELEDVFKFMTNREYIPDTAIMSRYNKIIDNYIKRKKELDLYDFTDSPEYLVKKLADLGMKLNYTHLFVDEVQDIDIWEYELISTFEGDVFAIGDPKQNIYQFRNSTGQIFEKLTKLGYNLYELKKNFRSYQEILDNAGADLIADRGYGGIVGGLELLDEDDLVILCRYNFQVLRLSSFFENVYTIHAYKGLEADNVFVVDFPVNDEESANVRFVALTRAKNKIGMGTFDEVMEIGRRMKYEL